MVATTSSVAAMNFHPDVDKLFQLMRLAGLPPLSAQSVEQARFFYRNKSLTLGGPSAAMAEVRGLKAPGPAGDIPLRLYRPFGVADAGLGLIYVHGGGWVLGDLQSHDKICRAIAAQTPCRVIAVDYRLAPEHAIPAGLNDVLAAVAWIASNTSQLGIEPNRLAIGGDSAGGNMSAVTCLEARGGGLKLCAQVLIYPSTDLTPQESLWPSRQQFAKVPPLNYEAFEWLRAHFLPKGDLDLKGERFSPLYAASHAGLPPALIVTAEYDPLRDEGKAYADRLAASGVAVRYREFPGQIHGFMEFGGILSSAGEAIGEIAGFLRDFP
jgi:acetyl esterase